MGATAGAAGGADVVGATTLGMVTITMGLTIPAGESVTGCCKMGICPIVFSNGELTMFPVDICASWAWFRLVGVRTDGERINGDRTGVTLIEGCMVGICVTDGEANGAAAAAATVAVGVGGLLPVGVTGAAPRGRLTAWFINC